MALTAETPQSPKTFKGFVRALGYYAPRKLGELRSVGHNIRALTGSRDGPKKG